MGALALPLGEILEEEPWLAVASPLAAAGEGASLADAFRTGMRRLAGGVCAVSVRHGTATAGLTATSVTSLSMEPPSLLVSIRRSSGVLEVLREARRFTVHLLAEAQAHEAEAYAGRLGPAARESLVAASPGSGPPRLPGALCHVDCRTGRLIPMFSHIIVVGIVTAVEIGETERPLVYFDGRFHALDRHS